MAFKTAWNRLKGRNLGEAADVLAAMVKDPDCLVVGTFSGAMTVAKMGLLICHMMEWGWLNILISTGALVAHGFIEETGRQHFKADSRFKDEELYRLGYDRIYDTLELEKNLSETEDILHEILDRLNPSVPISSEILNREIGKWLKENSEGKGILRTAFLKEIPIYIPAFTDSELGLDVASYMFLKAIGENPALSNEEALAEVRLKFNPFLDLNSYAQRILHAKKLGIFTIGGGVPRNWAQQVGPYIEFLSQKSGRQIPIRMFHYGVRICPEPVHWGGLSGCTYSEGISWGKFVSPEDGGRFAEVLCDATVAWPLLIKAVKERIDKEKNPR
jgi:deoxyhypusine synthase